MLTTQDALERALVPKALTLCGGLSAQVVTLPGQASNRRYHRVSVAGGSPASLIVMELDEATPKSEEATAGPPPTELPFINVLQYLERGGIAVPRLYAFEPTAGLLFLEDLGDRTLESAVLKADRAVRRRFYQMAIADLVALQRYTANHDPSCVAFSRSFSQDLLLWELHHFREWLLEKDRGVELRGQEREYLFQTFESIAKSLAEGPYVFVHRDYQSRNLMVQEGPRLRMIDFQDALLGPRAYDLVALLRDSYVELEPDLVDALLDDYLDAAEVEDRQAFRELFHLQTLQRKLKDAGRFIFIAQVKKNLGFLPSIPSSLRYVRAAFGQLPGLTDLQRLLGRYIPELA